MFGLHVHAVGNGVVVNHDGLFGRFGHGAHVGDGFAGIRHVDDGRHDHVAVHTQGVGALDETQRFAGAGFGHVGQHGDAALSRFNGDAGDFEFFFQRQRAGFTERAAGDQAVDAVADLEVDVAGRAFGINAFIGVELGSDGGENAGPAGIAHG